MSVEKTAEMVHRLPVEVQLFILGQPKDGTCSAAGALILWLCERVPILTINRALDGSGHWVVGLGRNGPVRWAASLAEALVLMVEEVERQEKASKTADGNGS